MITQAPDQVPYQIVGLAVRALPAGHRERYRREFTAELYFLPHRQQLRYATRILARVWALRVAVGGLAPAPIEEKAMSVKVIPLHCQLNLKHRWEFTAQRTAATDSGYAPSAVSTTIGPEAARLT